MALPLHHKRYLNATFKVGKFTTTVRCIIGSAVVNCSAIIAQKENNRVISNAEAIDVPQQSSYLVIKAFNNGGIGAFYRILDVSKLAIITFGHLQRSVWR